MVLVRAPTPPPHPHHIHPFLHPFILSSLQSKQKNKSQRGSRRPCISVCRYLCTPHLRVRSGRWVYLDTGLMLWLDAAQTTKRRKEQRSNNNEGTTKEGRKEGKNEGTTKERRRKEGSNLPRMYLHPTFHHIYPLPPMLNRGRPGCGYIGWDSLSLTLITLVPFIAPSPSVTRVYTQYLHMTLHCITAHMIT